MMIMSMDCARVACCQGGHNRGMAGRLEDRLRDPLVWTDVLQLVKMVAAAVIAWLLAVEVFSLPQSFLAPWAALLTVHATVYSSWRAAFSKLPAPWRCLARLRGRARAWASAGPLWRWCCWRHVRWARCVRCERSRPPLPPPRSWCCSWAIATTVRCCWRGWPTRSSGSRSVSSSTSRSGRRCATVVRAPHRRPRRPPWSAASRHGRRAPKRRRSRARRLGGAHPRAGSQHRRRLGRRSTGAREWTAQPPSPGRAAHPGHTRPRRGAGRARAGGRGHAQHGANDRPGRRRRRLGATLPRRLGRHPRPRRGRGARCHVDDVHRVREDLESLARRPPDTNGDRARRPVQGALVVNLRNILEAMAPVAAAQPVRVRSRHDLRESPGDKQESTSPCAAEYHGRARRVSSSRICVSGVTRRAVRAGGSLRSAS